MNPFKSITLLAALGCSLAGTASAITYVEDFEASFPTWESGWLGTNSNLQNVYGVGAGRGNNPDGLWIFDGSNSSSNSYIYFNSAFGSTLTSLSFDIATWDYLTIEIFDSSGNTLGSWQMDPNQGAWSDPGVYDNFSVTSNNGIGGFRILGNGVEGNTSIDNVVANGSGVRAVPDAGSSLILVVAGLVSLGMVRRRARS